jgi:sec-independent protein translocase protein TatB
MFDVGYSELLVIAIVLIVVIGPKDLPKMLRAFGKAMTRFRQVSGDFRRQFDEALKESELGEVKKAIDSARSLDPRSQLRSAFSPLTSAVNDVKRDVMQAGQVIPKVAELAPMPAASVAPVTVAEPVKAKAKPAVKAASKAPEKITKTAARKPAAPAVAAPAAKARKKAAAK